MDEKKVEGQTQPQVSSAANPAPSSGNAKVISRFGESNAQPKVQPAQPQVQQTQANVPPKTNAAPTAPIANSAQASTPQPAQSVPTAYYSANTSKTAQKIDPFAEQNAKRAEKKAKTKKQAKKGIIISAAIAIVAIVVVVLAVILLNHQNKPAAPTGYAELSEEEKINRNTTLKQDIYNQATKNSTNTSSGVAAVEKNFQQLISSSQNLVDTQIARVAAMSYLILQSNYDQILQYGQEVSNSEHACENSTLDYQTQITCHNLVGLAYKAKGNEELSNYHMNMVMTLMDEGGLGYGI